MTVRRRLAVVFTAAAVGGVLTAVPAHADTGTPGASGAGDRYFPLQGNGGYDVAHYDLRLRWQSTGMLGGVARIQARANQDLSRFDLDLKPNMTVSSVQVNGAVATFTQPPADQQELIITPAKDLPDGAPFTVDVRYRGVAQNTTDPDGSLDGWIRTDDGVFVASEPQGSPTWFPVNDTPQDKATYAISMTVPRGLAAISNGELVARRHTARTSTWSWRLDQPVSSYLITATIGRFDVRTGHTASGIPYLIAVDPRERAAVPVLRKLPAMIEFLAKKYGRYPFGQAGAIVDHAPNVGYALETATRPLFDRAPSESTLVHELAHQWYGDGVTLARWRDIWINEGFAEFSSWLWEEHTGGRTTAQHLTDLLSIPASDGDEWKPPPGNPGAGDEIFAGSVYDRGAATLAALREKVGDATFFAIMRGWFAKHVYGNATVKQFTVYAAAVAHEDLTAFFRTWLFSPDKPTR